jgi:DNA-binding NarL/FixJ family response regulator
LTERADLMKALLLFSSDFLRNRVQSLLDAQAISSQHIDSQILISEFIQVHDTDLIIADEQNMHNILNISNLNSIKTLIISSGSEAGASIYIEMLENVDGIIHQDFTDDTLIQAMEEISNGMAFICPRIASSLKTYFQYQKNRFSHLSEKELEVVKLLVRGERYATIAELLNMSINTVRFHVKNIYRKHNIHNKTVLSRYFHDLVYNHTASFKPIYTEV